MTPFRFLNMTVQAVFDRAVAGLAAQKFQPSVNGSGCSYRGEGGRKCAVGHLIDDDEYLPSMEGKSAMDLLGGPSSNPVHSFVAQLQRAHDRSTELEAGQDPVRYMKNRLMTIGRDHELVIPEVLK